MSALDTDDLVFAMRLASRSADIETASPLIEQMARFTTGVLEPLGRDLDRQGTRLEDGRVRVPPAFKSAFETYAADGWLGLALPEEWGGAGLPELTQVAISEMVNGACVPFGMLALVARAGGRALIEHADPEVARKVLAMLISGEGSATIAMTEPNAGSDVSGMRTRAAPLGNGRFALTGTKSFISFGDHDITERIFHILLARDDEADGGFSLFVVPNFPLESSDRAASRISVVALEHKLGLNGSPTCQLALDGVEAYRLGAAGRGLGAIFTMVNTMRLEVAVQGVALAGAATREAWAYAAGRVQGKTSAGAPATIDQHADVRRMLMTMRAQSEGVRALVYHAASLFGAKEHADLLALLLPICKFAASEIAVEVSNIGLQAYGGHGYLRDHRIEQIVRDARILPIYEGTSGIQGIDLAMRKLRGRKQQGFPALRAQMAADLDTARGQPEISGLCEAFARALVTLDAATGYVMEVADDDALAAATPYIMLISNVAIAWMWLRAASAVDIADAAKLASKRRLASFYFTHILLSIWPLEARIRAGHASLPHVGEIV